MPNDSDLDLLSLVHAMQAKTTLCVNQLNAKLAANPDSTHIELRSEGTANLVFLLENQSKLLVLLLEENQSIKDRLEGLLRTYLEKE